MSSGSHLNHGRYPAPVCGYLRNLAGWADNEIILNNPGRYQVKQGDYGTVHKYLVPNRPNEYFIVENRSRMGLDTHCQSNGLAVYHCDILGSNEWQGGMADKHYQCALIQADGARKILKKEKIENRTIPDLDIKGINCILSLAETGKVTQAKVFLELDHSYQGDLTITLTPPRRANRLP